MHITTSLLKNAPLPALCLSLLFCACSPREALPADLAAMQKTVKNGIAPFAECYELGQKSDANLGGPISLKMIVREDGTTTDVRLISNSLGDAVGKCFTEAFQQLKFPRISRDSIYEESFCFEPDPKGTRCQKKN